MMSAGALAAQIMTLAPSRIQELVALALQLKGATGDHMLHLHEPPATSRALPCSPVRLPFEWKQALLHHLNRSVNVKPFPDARASLQGITMHPYACAVQTSAHWCSWVEALRNSVHLPPGLLL